MFCENLSQDCLAKSYSGFLNVRDGVLQRFVVVSHVLQLLVGYVVKRTLKGTIIKVPLKFYELEPEAEFNRRC